MFDADRGQPDNAIEAYYDYLDGCEAYGIVPLGFDGWKADRRHREYFARRRVNAAALKASGYVGRAFPLDPHS